jgi:dipeptidyl aminopeptidase/acylaminoacyl peptidase
MKLRRTILLLAVATVVAQAAPLQRGTPSSLTIAQLIDIRHPSSPIWSPDGRHVAFLSERAGVATMLVADPDVSAGSARAGRVLTDFPEGVAGGFFWSADSQRLYFPRGGDLWQVPIDGGQAHAVWATPAAETTITPSPDATRVAFVRGGSDLVVRSLVDGGETPIVHADNKTIGSVSWAPDGKRLLFNAGAGTIRHEQTPPYAGAKIIYTISERTPGETLVIAATGGAPTPLPRAGGFGGSRWIDPTHFVFDRQSADYKRRTISFADIAGGEPRVLHEDVDEKFWSIPGQAEAGPQPSPDGKWIALLSDRDGWDHLYVMATPTGDRRSSGEPIQITKGRFEAWRPAWSRDGTRIAFDANDPDHPGDRHLGIVAINGDPARATVSMITTGRGTDTAPVWSPDGTRIVYQHTDAHNSADLWVVDVASRKSTRLSDSMPASIDRAAFVEPEFVRYPGPDGQQVPGWLFVPKSLDRAKKHPAIVWIHGDGINQNYDGWHVQRNYAVYYSFHQYLLQQGYVVFAPDYRGSIGYGRAWRQGVYMDVGGNDAKDAWMAAAYLKTLGYVDADRIGVWGLSYGGFFTLIAATDQPTLFRAAVDVAGVADYAMYYEDPYHGGWTVSRIGTPEQHPQVYAQASPLSHVDRLERPLLVLHGTADVNVPYLHSVRLIDELLKKGKSDLVSFMTYPGEFHYFTREHVLRDAWHRVDEFFDLNLKGGPQRLRSTSQP